MSGNDALNSFFITKKNAYFVVALLCTRVRMSVVEMLNCLTFK